MNGDRSGTRSANSRSGIGPDAFRLVRLETEVSVVSGKKIPKLDLVFQIQDLLTDRKFRSGKFNLAILKNVATKDLLVKLDFEFF